MDGEVIRSIKRSRTRTLILKYLWDKYPEKAYLSEITRFIHSDVSNIHGALNGMLHGRWALELSLVSLGLVDKIHLKNHVYYRLNNTRIQDIQDILNLINAKSVMEVLE